MFDLASFFQSSKTTDTTKAVNPIIKMGFSVEELFTICAAKNNMSIYFLNLMSQNEYKKMRKTIISKR
jgi:hypothetical protein